MENKETNSENVLDEFYRKPAYIELIIELEEKLKNIPLEIERLQIEYYKKCVVMLDSYDMKDKKKETIEKIKDLREDELDYKETINKIKKKYGALYGDICESVTKRTMKRNIFIKK